MPPSDANPDSTGPSRGPSPAGTYEFTGGETRVIARLGERMHFVGLFALGLGVAAVAAGAVGRDPGPVLYGVLFGLIGFWTARAGSRFRSVARTEGHDLGHLMAALENLRTLYTFEYWVCLVGLVGVLVLFGSSYLY